MIFSKSLVCYSLIALPKSSAFFASNSLRWLSSASPPASLSMASSISVSDSFDGGNVELVEIGPEQGEGVSHFVKVRIKPDAYTVLEQKNHLQHFCFRSTISGIGADSRPLAVRYIIDNASETSYSVAWNGYTVFYSDNLVDSDSWFRNVDTEYKDGKLVWTHEHEGNGSVYFSYFPPYPYSRHLDLISRSSRFADVQSLGQTLEGREMDCVSTGSGDRVCWIIHRQHPGENMAEYFAEGLLTRLLGLDREGEVDGLVRKILEDYTFYIVPNMCPDGAIRGHLRTNSVGANLNREWADSKADNYEAPTLERSPEVYHVLNKMDETGVDCFLDIHGDEELPFNFLSGAEETTNWGKRLEALHGAFLAAYERANSDIQRKISYEPSTPEQAARFGNIATNAVANRFNCLSATLEMPFKDCLTNPDPKKGWSPNRAFMLGASILDALSYVAPYLKAEGDFWEDLSSEDNYIRPSSRYT